MTLGFRHASMQRGHTGLIENDREEERERGRESNYRHVPSSAWDEGVCLPCKLAGPG